MNSTGPVVEGIQSRRLAARQLAVPLAATPSVHLARLVEASFNPLFENRPKQHRRRLDLCLLKPLTLSSKGLFFARGEQGGVRESRGLEIDTARPLARHDAASDALPRLLRRLDSVAGRAEQPFV